MAVNTELGLGLAEPRQRQFRKIEPTDVADAIIETLQVPTFDVHVPKQLEISERVSALLPMTSRTGCRAIRAPMRCLAGRHAVRAPTTKCAPHAPSPGSTAAPEQARITETAGDPSGA